MTIHLIPCGPTANESEEKSFSHIKSRLISEAIGQEWILLTNVAFSVKHDLKSDEIDLIAIGPGGVQVIEIKHWTASWVEANREIVEAEVEKLASKARRIATTVRKTMPDHPFISGTFLLSKETTKIKDISIRGVKFYGLREWKEVIDFERHHKFTPQQVQLMARHLQPQSMVSIDGSLRRLAGYINLELQSPKEERFHRVYKGQHPSRRDQVMLHLYDLSADDKPNAAQRAKRAFDALHRLQLYPWAPRILDSYQDAPGFAGEMHFFTMVDPVAPTLSDRSADTEWTMESRIAFAKVSLDALSELHHVDTDQPLIHRNIHPGTILGSRSLPPDEK